jgi:hypothetical protein
MDRIDGIMEEIILPGPVHPVDPVSLRPSYFVIRHPPSAHQVVAARHAVAPGLPRAGGRV